MLRWSCILRTLFYSENELRIDESSLTEEEIGNKWHENLGNQ